jgi:four helix bundle protein
MSYRKLEVWQMERQLSIDIHKMTLAELPKHELYETGSQIRRSIKSVRSNIVEGYGRKKYQPEYFKHLIYALGSNDETIDHLETLWETESLRKEELFQDLLKRLQLLGKKLNLLVQAIEQGIRINKIAASGKKPVIISQKPEASGVSNKIEL